MPKGTFLILDTDWTGEIKDGDIVDGKVVLKRGKQTKEFILSIPRMDKEKKEFFDDVKPIYFKGKLGGTKPMYILKWNSLYPVAFELKEEFKTFVSPDTNESLTMKIQSLEPIKPEFKDTKILPEMLAETHDMRFLKHMKKYQTGGGGVEAKGIIMFAGIILLLGGIGYLVYYFFLGGNK